MANAAAALVAAATAAGAAVAAPPAASQPAARGVATAEQPAVPIMPATAAAPLLVVPAAASAELPQAALPAQVPRGGAHWRRAAATEHSAHGPVAAMVPVASFDDVMPLQSVDTMARSRYALRQSIQPGDFLLQPQRLAELPEFYQRVACEAAGRGFDVSAPGTSPAHSGLPPVTLAPQQTRSARMQRIGAAVWPPSAEALGWPLQSDSVALSAQHGAVLSQPARTGPPWDNNTSRRRVDGGRAFGAEAGAWLLVHPLYSSNPRQSGPHRAPPMRPSGMLCAAHESLHSHFKLGNVRMGLLRKPCPSEHVNATALYSTNVQPPSLS